MFNNFGFIGSKILKDAEEERKLLSHPYVGSEHLLLAILKNNSEIKDRLEEIGLTYKKFKQELIDIVGIPKKNIDVNLYTPLLKRVLSNALSDAKENNKGVVTESHLLLAMLEEGEGIAIRIMIGMNINLDDLYDELKIKPQNIKGEKLEVMTVGRVLNDLTNNFDKVIGRDKEINSVIEVLMRKKQCNPLLIGPAGVGKTAIVEELARRIKNKEVPMILLNKKIIDLPMGDLVSGTKYRGEFEERLTKIIKEIIKNKNIILFIDEIHTMVNAGGAEGAINAGDILKPYLARGEIKVIGATTTEEYERFISKDKALERRFETILIKEPTLEETKEILKGLKETYEHHHNIKITNENIEDMTFLANKYLFTKKNPDKTIDLLDSVCAYVKRKNLQKDELIEVEKKLKELTKLKEKSVLENKFNKALDICLKISELESKIKSIKESKNDSITKEDILRVIEAKSNIPLFVNKKEILEKLKKELFINILYEEEPLNKLIENLKLFYEKEHQTKLLLIGPSGIGKTSSVKLISKITGNHFIRLDMSEYKDSSSLSKLIGTHGGYIGYNDSFILKEVKYNPYSIILVDELEKAHPSVMNLFLQIMDEGTIHDAHGEEIDFSHTLIIMTSNAYKNNFVGFLDTKKDNLTEYFSEEFLGRFDDIIEFNALTKEQALSYLKEKIQDENLEYEKLLKDTSYEKYGFRYLNKIIDKYKLKIEN